jgi:uncharacterized protein (DUF4213/DUF364 family)/nucleoside-triphosphatase THEP1
MTDLRPVVPPPLRPGAVIHGPGTDTDQLLDRFVTELQRRGFRIAGLVQRNHGPGDECAELMELVDISTGRAFDISQKLGRESQSCRVDPRGVADASQVVRRALDEHPDLLVINKFGGLEAHGQGLAAEMLDGMADGIPVLTSVGSRYLNEWQAFTGGYAELLAPADEALWRWWGPYRLYQDLLLGLRDAEVRRVVVGAQWIMVETDDAVGLAARPSSVPDAQLPPPDAWQGKSLSALAEQAACAWNPFGAALGIAALNAHYNHAGLTGDTVNGLDLFAGVEGRLVVIGGFPQIARRLPKAQVVEIKPGPGEYPEVAGEWLLPGAEAVAITSSTLANRTLPRLLAAAGGARVAVIGPGTPLTPRLFSYGVETLAGFVVENREAVARTILEGGSSQAFHHHGRFVTLRRTDR